MAGNPPSARRPVEQWHGAEGAVKYQRIAETKGLPHRPVM